MAPRGPQNLYRRGVGRSLVALLALAACGDDLHYGYAGLLPVSGDSPYASNCNGAMQDGTAYRNAEVEPWLAIDPTDPSHQLAVWQQDRWDNGGANGNAGAVSFDGGVSWSWHAPAFSECAGGDYQRSSDPWVSIGPDGTAYAVAIAFDETTARSTVLASSSGDGVGWSDPALLIDDANDPDIFNDKESVTADPGQPGRAYAVWDRLTGLTQPTKPVGTGPTMLARATDGAWQPARAIYDPGVDAQTIGNVIVVMPDGTLVDAFDELAMTSTDDPPTTVSVITSSDHGDTWSPPVRIAPVMAVGVADPKHQLEVRSGDSLPQVAVDPTSGALYVAWEDARFATGARHDGVVIARSSDGGATWSQPVPVNGRLDQQAWEPTVAVAADGTVGVLYYDDRDDNPDDPTTFKATAWLATSHDGGQTWQDQALSSPFDLAPARIGDEYFLGDYQGLVGRDSDFTALFAVAFLNNDPTDIFVRP